MRANRLFGRILCVAFWALLTSGAAAFGADGPLRVDYQVKVASIDDQLLHVVTHVANVKRPTLDLSLPTWLPGLPKTEDYARNIRRFKITDGKGNRVARRMIDRQTWRLDTRGLDQFTVEFDYTADLLAIDQAKVSKEFAFFTGIQLFLKAEGEGASTVRFEVPAGWGIVSALKETSDPATFTAADYDTLVDAPTILGKFDLKRFEVGGKPHYFVTAPAGAFKPADVEGLTSIQSKIIAEQASMFDGLPYEKYVYFYFATQPDWKQERSTGGANSQVNFVPEGMTLTSPYAIYTASHDFYHLWNGKRIRPSDSLVIDYSRMSASPLLWMTEGFTNYFARLSRFRTGVDNIPRVLYGLSEVISLVRSNEARDYTSPADSSTLTWADYEPARQKPFKASAFTQGEIVAIILDISMRRDTNGAAGLEDVMRVLYRDYARKGRGFTADDLVSIINRLTRRDYADFFNRYVWDAQTPPLDQALAQVGYQYEEFTIQLPTMGFRLDRSAEGPRVAGIDAGSESEKGGLAVGDVIVSIDDVSAATGLASMRERLTPKIGQVIKIGVKRGGENKTLDVLVGSREESRHAVTELHKVTPEQLKLRELWLKKAETGRDAAAGGL